MLLFSTWRLDVRSNAPHENGFMLFNLYPKCCFLMGNRNKRKKRGSSSSNSDDMAANQNPAYQVKDAIDALRQAMVAGFAGLRSEMDKLRYELKGEIDLHFKTEMKDFKQSLESTQGDIDLMKEKAEKNLQETNARPKLLLLKYN